MPDQIINKKKSSIPGVLLLVFILSFFSSCHLIDSRRGDERIARVYGKYLYKSDLEGLVAPGISSADSAVIVKRYIDNWIRQQIFLYQAQANLNSEMINFERKIEDYRNSLYIFAFENELITQKLDTVITPELLEEYYERHQNEFQLRDHIVKVNFVKLPVDAPNINQVRRLIRSDNEEDMERLEEYCINHAASYFLEPDAWFIFTDILRELPLNPSNHENFIRNNRFIELNDQYYRYFLFIRDYRLEGSASPLTFQEDNIKAIILNHRKQTLINEYRQKLYLDAVGASAFEIF